MVKSLVPVMLHPVSPKLCPGTNPFLLYINDLPGTDTCNTSTYAGDTLLYQEVNTKQDQLDFQANIDAVYEWSQKWKMPFKVTKCHYGL